MDDGLCGGNQYFHEMIKRLEAKFPFGSRKTQSFVFTGIEMHQQNDHSIVMSQEKYVSKINPIHIQPQRKVQENLPVTERERQDLRALIGSLQYASVNTRPDLSSRLSFLQSEVNKATVETLIQETEFFMKPRNTRTHMSGFNQFPWTRYGFLLSLTPQSLPRNNQSHIQEQLS